MPNQSVSAVEKELAESIGAAAREARLALKITQEDAADLIGVSAEFYARIERGHALPSVPTLARICVTLGISADVLLGRAEPSRATKVPVRWKPAPLSDTAEVRRVLRLLRKASPATLRLVTLLMKELDRKL